MSTPAPPSDGPTPAQIAANRANAQRSTGPRTLSGKDRSRTNAAKHGVYARVSFAIEQGPFAEDPDEIEELLTQMVEALAPRNIHAECCARRIAMLQLQGRRLDAREAALLQQIEVANRLEREELADTTAEEVRGHIADWNAARLNNLSPQDEPDTDQPPWEPMAVWLRIALQSKISVQGLWDAEREPTSPKEWRQAFEAIARHRFPKAHQMAAFLGVQRDQAAADAEARRDRGRRHMAVASMDTMDDCNRKRARITNELKKQWAMYALLQDLEVDRQE